jgi:ankyrin repeat protein
VVKYLVSQGADSRAQTDTAFILASQFGQLPVVEYLISQGADVRAQNDMALTFASIFGSLRVVEYLISHGADVRAKNNTALVLASKYRHFSIVEYLVSQGADINVLPPESRRRYQHLTPRIISIPDYYRLEPSLLKVSNQRDRFILSDTHHVYFILK